jgi:hypothetical protein
MDSYERRLFAGSFASVNGMGVVDMETLDRCVHWRKVGRAMIFHLNLTRMLPATGDDDCCSHLFVSFQDLISVLSSNKGVALQIMDHLPDVLVAWAKGTRWYVHATAILDSMHQHLSMEYLHAAWQKLGISPGSNETWTSPNASSVAEKEVRQAADRWMKQHMHHLSLLHASSAHQNVQRRAASNHDAGDAHAGEASASYAPGSQIAYKEGTKEEEISLMRGTHGRRLLQANNNAMDNPQQTTASDAVDAYSSLVSSQKGFADLALSRGRQGSLVTETWLEGPFGWPPRSGMCLAYLVRHLPDIRLCVCVCDDATTDRVNDACLAGLLHPRSCWTNAYSSKICRGP